jgi:hypothetical protein
VIPEATALSQLLRLAQFPGAPKDVREWDVYIPALQQAASQEHARLAIDRVIATLRHNEAGFVPFPLPAEIADTLESVSTVPPPSADCEICRGTGWVHERRIVDGEPYDFSAQCACSAARKRVA